MKRTFFESLLRIYTSIENVEPFLLARDSQPTRCVIAHSAKDILADLGTVVDDLTFDAAQAHRVGPWKKLQRRAHLFHACPDAHTEAEMVATWHAGYLLASMTWYDLGVTDEARQSCEMLCIIVHPPSAICDWIGWSAGRDVSPKTLLSLIEQALERES